MHTCLHQYHHIYVHLWCLRHALIVRCRAMLRAGASALAVVREAVLRLGACGGSKTLSEHGKSWDVRWNDGKKAWKSWESMEIPWKTMEIPLKREPFEDQNWMQKRLSCPPLSDMSDTERASSSSSNSPCRSSGMLERECEEACGSADLSTSPRKASDGKEKLLKGC